MEHSTGRVLHNSYGNRKIGRIPMARECLEVAGFFSVLPGDGACSCQNYSKEGEKTAIDSTHSINQCAFASFASRREMRRLLPGAPMRYVQIWSGNLKFDTPPAM